MNDDELFELYLSEAADKQITGWDFPYNRDTLVTSPLTWSYSSKILPYVRTAKSLLDMGTGGGEFLSTLHPLPKKTCATEAYVPNVPVAKKRLEPLGIKVVQIDEDETAPLPFENEEFELVINRHEFYLPEEVHRILQPGGYFITQQVGGRNNSLFRKIILGDENYENEDWLEWHSIHAAKALQDVGFKIVEHKEHLPLTRLFDVGALVYHLNNIPWEVPNFSVEKHRDKLYEIHMIIQKQGYLDLLDHRFFILAKKPLE